MTGTNQTIESPSRSTRSSRLALAPIRLQRLNHIDGSEHVTRLTNQLRGALPFKQRQLGPHSVAGHRRMSGQETSSTTSHGSTKQRQSRNFTPRSAPPPPPRTRRSNYGKRTDDQHSDAQFPDSICFFGPSGCWQRLEASRGRCAVPKAAGIHGQPTPPERDTETNTWPPQQLSSDWHSLSKYFALRFTHKHTRTYTHDPDSRFLLVERALQRQSQTGGLPRYDGSIYTPPFVSVSVR